MKWLLVLAAACGANAPSATPIATSTTTQLSLGADVGLVNLDGTLYLFERDKVTISRAGTVVARAEAPKKTQWSAAAGLTGPQGARWAVGIAGDALYRVTSFGELEAVGARLGVGDARVLSIAGSGSAFAIGLSNGVAISRDGRHVMRFDGGEAKRVAITDARAAVAFSGRIEAYDLERTTRKIYSIDDVSALGFIDRDKPRLVVVSKGDVFVEDGGTLRRMPTPRDLSHVAISGSRVWMIAGRALYVRTDRELAKTSLSVAKKSRVFAGAAGDVWLAEPARVARHALDDLPAATWRADVEPVFARACKQCHERGGEAGLDLATVDRWREHADTLRSVLGTGTMPPPEVTLTEPDRQKLLEWLGDS